MFPTRTLCLLGNLAAGLMRADPMWSQVANINTFLGIVKISDKQKYCNTETLFNKNYI